MISPLQLSDFVLHSLRFTENTAFAGGNASPTAFRLTTGARLVQEFVSGTGEVTPVPLTLDVQTALQKLEREAIEPSDAEVFEAFISVEVNSGEDVAKMAPFSLSIVCSGMVNASALPADEEQRTAITPVIRANSAGLLYGMARQLILQLTHASASGQGLLLPSLSFKEIVQAEMDEEAAAA